VRNRQSNKAKESPGRHPVAIVRFAPWLLFAAFIWWGWRDQDLARSLPAYGDTLELTWALSWYDDALRQGLNPLLAPVAFYPIGWDLKTYATGFLFLPALLPLYRLAGSAFAYNVAVLFTFALSFGGMLALAGRFMGRLAATIAALLFTFWGLRWFQTIGHLNFLLGPACFPWLVLTLERFFRSSSEANRITLRSLRWLALAGIIWAATIAGSLYFIWIGGLLVAGWIAGRWLGGEISQWTVGIALIGSATIALLVSAPVWWDYWRATTAIGASPPDLGEVNFWGASINSLPLPYVFHPWLGSFATAVYRGITYEQSATNFGLIASIAAMAGWRVAWQEGRRRWLPIFVLTLVALLLCLGLTLKWDNISLQWDALRPVNAMLWQIGHWLKPEVFSAGSPPAPFDAAVPLPGLLLSAVVPLFERARVFARYGFVAALGLFLLAGLSVERLRRRYAVRWLLAAMLICEVIPPPLTRVPFPPPSHPAFEWLKQQPDGAVADLLAAHPNTLVLISRGETVWATRLHGKPAVGGASSIWPAATTFLNEWLATHPHPFAGPTVVALLRFYGTRYILMHMTSDWETSVLEEAKQNRELRFRQCFDPPAKLTAWPYPICVLEVLPPTNAAFNLAPIEGWSAQEDWGVWAVGPESKAGFVAMTRRPYRLILEAFPNCMPGRTQTMVIEINAARLVEHKWTNCDPWAATITISTDVLRPGGNELTFRPAYALAPTTGDTRPLSVGFSRLQVEPEPTGSGR
jgi:hypothetical protein